MPESPFTLDEMELAGPTGLAAKCEALLPDLLVQRDAAKTKTARKKLNSRIHTTRMLLRWCKTRAGYRPPSPSSRRPLMASTTSEVGK